MHKEMHNNSSINLFLVPHAQKQPCCENWDCKEHQSKITNP